MSDSESVVHYNPISQEEFRGCVKEYIAIYDRLADMRKDTAMLNKRKKRLTETIIAFMKDNEKDYCNLGEKGSLQVKTSKSKLALKKEDIERILIQMGTSEDKSKETAEFLCANKTVVERSTLRRSTKPLE